MSSFKYHIGNKFSSCRLLAVTWDVYRNREVRVFMIPSTFDHVGVADGTDAWVAPVVADPFKVNIREILGKIQSGENPPVVTTTPNGKTVVAAPPVKERRRLRAAPPQVREAQPAPPQRRRLQA